MKVAANEENTQIYKKNNFGIYREYTEQIENTQLTVEDRIPSVLTSLNNTPRLDSRLDLLQSATVLLECPSFKRIVSVVTTSVGRNTTVIGRRDVCIILQRIFASSNNDGVTLDYEQLQD